MSYDIAIVGAGPAGLSAAARAAACGLSHVLLEGSSHLANTVYHYQKGKHVMAEPSVLPLRSDLEFEIGKREKVLADWFKGVGQHRINVQFNTEVTAIRGRKGQFSLILKNGSTFQAANIVLSIGVQGNPRKLGVPGSEIDQVLYTLDDPDDFNGKTIVVVGAGDAAIENALALMENNTVYIVNRRDEFARAKEGNRQRILQAINNGRLECFYLAGPAKIEKIKHSDQIRLVLKAEDGEASIDCDFVIARLGAVPQREFVESCGIRFPSHDPAAVPTLSSHYESNVPGIYIVGALGGYPLIKQCMNQGYEVIEYIQGNSLEPADEPLLQAKCDALEGRPSVNQILSLIQKNVPVFAQMTPLQLREFLLDSELHNPQRKSVIFERNDYSSTFFSIIEGEVFVQADPQKPGKTIRLSKGDFFGEMSLISGRRRSATIIAGKDCILLETPRNSMNKLINSNDSVKQLIDQVFITRFLQANFAPRTGIELLHEIAAACRLHRYEAGEIVFEEGEDAHSLHLVRRGSLTISRNIGGREIVLSYVAAGNYVGEMGIMGAGSRTATVKAAVKTETIELDAEAFEILMLKNLRLREKIQEEYKNRIAQNMLMQQQPESGDIISFLIEQGIGEATDVLLIDESLCTRCNNCETACAETHGGISRLDRQAGPSYAYVHVPTSCRHCEHPHCMKDCPPDAIHRAPNGEVFIEDNCIGCGNCEQNCPYGVIQMAVEKDEKQSLLQWFLFGEKKVATHPENKNDSPIKKAVKCDMCKELPTGPACVQSCPTGAAIRIAPEKLSVYLNKR